MHLTLVLQNYVKLEWFRGLGKSKKQPLNDNELWAKANFKAEKTF